ncbi:MAG: DUF5107 domain-containing protein, partial [Butyrivibrio sp.]|nr:DUF5107 domain-containing protein [Butyrivibrio sp.]
MEAARIWEEEIVIPTYEVGAPDRNPMFLEKRVYQGSSGRIYPYPATSDISLDRTDHTWHAVCLENQYLKVMILPELGGRIQRATDKTNGYDFIYYNHVIKPALVGLLGPWISGGIEFNWPQHHRPTTYMPVDHQLVTNEDGSVTLQTSDVDQMYGTKEVTSFTLYPDKAYIEIRGQLYNRTNLPHTFRWWANPAVSVNAHTRSIFPPDVHNVYDHGKRAVSRFPIATGEYYKYDYSEGVDISRYRNVPVPTSYMAERSDYDFVGNYDDSVDAGLLHIADHHISPGKKQWTWGCGDFGKAWDRNLTDADGPYIELMTGMYCENQPDFSWLAPFEEKRFCQYFMPYKLVGQVSNASKEAVLRMEPLQGALHLVIYATAAYEDAQIVITEQGRELARETVTVSPTQVYDGTIAAAYEDATRVRVSVQHGGRELVSCRLEEQGIPELAEPARAPAHPRETRTTEELYLTAQHIEQYRHATWLPDPYYLEGLKRDPGDSRINNAYGLLLLRRGQFEKAEGYFRTAIRRLTGDGMFNNPYNGEAFYNLGLALFYQERYEEAFDAFYKATWSNEQQEMAFYYLAAIAAARGAYEEALAFVERGLVKNAHNVKARGLKAGILLRLGRREEAQAQIVDNLALDAFDWVSRFWQAESSTGAARESHLMACRLLMARPSEAVLLIASDLAEAGFYEEAIRALSLCEEARPMLHYYRGYFLSKLGRESEALDAFREAAACDPTCTFPNKLQDLQVLLLVTDTRPEDGYAWYYLGNLLYDKLQFDEAIDAWEKGVARLPQFPTVRRNLAIALYNKRGDRERARALMEEAYALDETDARILLELDQLYRGLNRTPEERLAFLRGHETQVRSRDDLYVAFITLLNLCGQEEEALDRMRQHTFRTWEGAEGKVSAQFKTSLLALARRALAAGDPATARTMLEEALSYPENLGEGRLEGTKDNHLYYWLGIAQERLGEPDAARESFERAILGAQEVAGVMYYYDQPADMLLYQGRALE